MSLTSEQITEGNKLIAVFMGAKLNPTGFQDHWFTPKEWVFFEITKTPPSLTQWNKPENLLYNKSWDWLIPVLSTIDLLHADEKKNFKIEAERFIQEDIEGVWQIVIDFLKQYNP